MKKEFKCWRQLNNTTIMKYEQYLHNLLYSTGAPPFDFIPTIYFYPFLVFYSAESPTKKIMYINIIHWILYIFVDDAFFFQVDVSLSWWTANSYTPSS